MLRCPVGVLSTLSLHSAPISLYPITLSLPPHCWITGDHNPAPEQTSKTQPDSSFPSAALREVAMPSLSGQPIDFGGGHVGWLPTDRHARRGRPRSEVHGAASNRLQAWKKAQPMVERALIQPVPIFLLFKVFKVASLAKYKFL